MKEEKCDKQKNRHYQGEKNKLDKISEVRVDIMRRAIKMIKLNIYKKQQHFHTLTMSNLIRKLRNNFFYSGTKNKKILKNKLRK